MKTSDSKVLLGLVAGIAVGAAIGYLAASDKGEKLFDELKDLADKAKEGFGNALAAAKKGGCETLSAAKGCQEAKSE
ncbi:Gas vesicle protein [Bacteroidales bacterium Barb4]|nr:Gas vesicle protein [Bacteroidales bacterium Barb4]